LENLADRDPINLKFKDIGQTIPGWEKLTMVSSALWTDYDDDGWVDLIACGEFMPILRFHNNKGRLGIAEKDPGLSHSEGWWNSIAGGDFDNDGDTDYVLGNLGLNSKYRASPEEPLCIYAKDYDKDGRIDPVMCYYIEGENYLAHSRDEVIAQISAMRVRFQTYKSYAETPFDKAFLPEELADAYVVKSHIFESAYVENLGDGRFQLHPLPKSVQLGPVEGIVIEDIDKDGNLDVLMTGNSYTTEVATGRYDAIKGIVLKGDGAGNFSALSLKAGGFVNDSDGSGLALLQSVKGTFYTLVANNDGPLRIFEMQGESGKLAVEDNAQGGVMRYTDGRQRKIEFYYGSGYLSQGSRSIHLQKGIQEVKISNADGKLKVIYEKGRDD
jgi:hypothetical protein